MMNVVWSDTAKKNFRTILFYVYDQFGKRAMDKYNDAIFSAIDSLLLNPCLASKELLLDNMSVEFRSLVVQKLSKVIYYFDETTLYIVNVWDTRRNPLIMEEEVLSSL